MSAQPAPAAAETPIVCICGDRRFAAQFSAVADQIAASGRVAIGPDLVRFDPARVPAAVRLQIEDLYQRMIDLAGFVVVVCPGQALDAATKVKLQYAMRKGKRVLYTDGSAPQGGGRIAFHKALSLVPR